MKRNWFTVGEPPRWFVLLVAAFIAFLFFVGGNAFATDTLWVNSGDNDCEATTPEGQLASSIPSLDTIEFVITNTFGGTNYFFASLADGLNNADWETGAFTVKLNCIYSSGNTSDWDMQVKRYNAACISQEISAVSDKISNITTGEKVFTITSKNWTAGTATDRMILTMNAENGIAEDPDTVRFEVGVANSIVITSVTDGWYKPLDYVGVVDTITGDVIQDAALVGWEDCEGEVGGENCMRWNFGMAPGLGGSNNYIGAGKYSTNGQIEYVMYVNGNESSSGADSVMLQLYPWTRETNGDTLFIHALLGDSAAATGKCFFFQEGGDVGGAPYNAGNGIGPTWKSIRDDTSGIALCYVDTTATAYGWGDIVLTGVVDTVTISDTGAFRVDILDLLTYSDTVGAVRLLPAMRNGLLIRGSTASSSSIRWYSSEYGTEARRPMIIRYSKQAVTEIGKKVSGASTIDTLVVGDTLSSSQKVNIRRWHNNADSANFNFDLSSVSVLMAHTNDTTYQWSTSDSNEIHEIVMSDSGSIEWLIKLAAKPAGSDTVWTLPIETSNLDFYKQPLTEFVMDSILDDGGKDTVGVNNVDSLKGSYAVYHKTRSGNIRQNDDGDTTLIAEFMTGKAFHIYNTYISHPDGTSKVWGWIDVDTINDSISAIVPYSYLDSCTYPVVIGPTIGWTSKGSYSVGWDNETTTVNYEAIPTEATSDGVLQTAYWWGRWADSDENTSCTTKVGVYTLGATETLTTYLDSTASYEYPAYSATFDSPLSMPFTAGSSISSGSDYVVASLSVTEGRSNVYAHIASDIVSPTNTIREKVGTDLDFPANLDGASSFVFRQGLYAEYVTEAPSERIGRRRRLLLTGEYRRIYDEENIPVAYSRFVPMLHR